MFGLVTFLHVDIKVGFSVEDLLLDTLPMVHSRIIHNQLTTFLIKMETQKLPGSLVLVFPLFPRYLPHASRVMYIKIMEKEPTYIYNLITKPTFKAYVRPNPEFSPYVIENAAAVRTIQAPR